MPSCARESRRTEIYTLSLHDALPIYLGDVRVASSIETPQPGQRERDGGDRTGASQSTEGQREAQRRPRRHHTGPELTGRRAERVRDHLDTGHATTHLRGNRLVPHGGAKDATDGVRATADRESEEDEPERRRVAKEGDAQSPQRRPAHHYLIFA